MPLLTRSPVYRRRRTRTVHVGPDEMLYVSVGSSCNVCEESDARRAALLGMMTP